MGLAQDFKDLGRLNKIVGVFAKYGFEHVFDRIKLSERFPFRQRGVDKFINLKTNDAVRLRKAFEELGPTFIKLGQLLSLRQDLIPKEYCDEFSKLMDRVPGFPFNQVKKIIREDLKVEIDEVFSIFKEEPIASASIGQVHEAVLRNNERVAVKVQRPDIRRTIHADIDIMYHIAGLIERYYPDLKIIKPIEIIKEFERYTKEEIDYNIEGQHIMRFYKNFRDDVSVTIPKVYWDYTNKRVLTMTFIDGTKISESETLNKKMINKKLLLKTISNSFMEQVFDFGYFHADPHPANIFVIKNNRIAWLDFGIVGRLDEKSRAGLANLFVSLIKTNREGIASACKEIGLVGTELDEERFKEDLDELGRFYDVSLEHTKTGDVFNTILSIARKHNIIIPTNFVLLGKALVTLEGVGRDLDPSFNAVKEAEPFVDNLIARKYNPLTIAKDFVRDLFTIRGEIKKVPQQTVEVLNKLSKGELTVQFQHQDVRNLQSELARSSNQVVMGLIIAALVIGSSLVLSTNRNPYIAYFGFFMAIVLVLFLVRSMIKEKEFIG